MNQVPIVPGTEKMFQMFGENVTDGFAPNDLPVKLGASKSDGIGILNITMLTQKDEWKNASFCRSEVLDDVETST